MKALRNTLFEENHIHSTFSDGQHSIRQILEYNYYHDQLDLIFADHVDKNTDWFSCYVKEIQECRKNYPQFAVRIGCEVKILEDGTLNTRPDILEAAEVVIGSVHHFSDIKTMGAEEMIQKEYKLSLLIAQHPDVDIFGHPFSMCNRFHKASPPMGYVRKLYELCKKNGIKFECNAAQAIGSVRALIESEIANGHTEHFSFGSDVHEQLDEIGNATFGFVERITVLVTGAGAGVGQSIIKSLKLSSVRTRIIATDMNPLAAGLYRSDVAYIVPSVDDPAYLSVLQDICTTEHAHLLLIGTDVELDILSKNKDAFEKETGTHIVVSAPETVEIADDKWKTMKFLASHNFPYIRSSLVEDVDDFLCDIQFPVVIKPRCGARSIGFQIVDDEATLRIRLETDGDSLIQEYLPENDEEYTCGAIFYENECYGVIPMKRWLRDGDTYKAIAKHNPDMEHYIEEVGKTLDIMGPCNFQLRYSNGEYKILEINCRFSGTTGAASALGFNVVNALLQKICFGRSLRCLVFRESYVFRYWNEVLVPLDAVDAVSKGHSENPSSTLNKI
ncbi:MAG: ATP-grasp domain-containing protein [Candidatus Peribacteraceae bacterium]